METAPADLVRDCRPGGKPVCFQLCYTGNLQGDTSARYAVTAPSIELGG